MKNMHRDDGADVLSNEEIHEVANVPDEDYKDYVDEDDEDFLDDNGKVDLTKMFPRSDDNPIDFIYTKDSTGRVISVECCLKGSSINSDLRLKNSVKNGKSSITRLGMIVVKDFTCCQVDNSSDLLFGLTINYHNVELKLFYRI